MCHLLKEVYELIWDCFEEFAKGSISPNADSSSAEDEKKEDAPGQSESSNFAAETTGSSQEGMNHMDG